MKHGILLMILTVLFLPGYSLAGPTPEPEPPLKSALEVFYFTNCKIEKQDFDGALKVIKDEYAKLKTNDVDLVVSVKDPETDAEKRGIAQVPEGKWMNFDASGMTAWDALLSVATMGGYKMSLLADTIQFFPVPEMGDDPTSDKIRVAPDFPQGTVLWHEGARKQGLKELFLRVGIVFPEGAGVLFEARTSSLLVQQTSRNHTLIRQLLSRQPMQLQIMISTKLIHLPQLYLKETKAVTATKYELMKKEWAANKGGDIYPVPAVVTRNWQKAMVDLSQEVPYPDGTGKEGETTYTNYSAGLQIDVTAGLSGDSIALKGQVRLNSFKNRSLKDFVLKLGQREDWKGHKKENLNSMTADFASVLGDGEFLAVPCAQSADPVGQVIALIKVDLIDAAGLPIRVPKE